MAINDLASADALRVAALETKIRNAQSALAADQRALSAPRNQNASAQSILRNTIAQQEEIIADLQAQLAVAQAAAAASQSAAVQPTASSADITAQAQTARDDGANSSAGPVAPLQVGPDGRVAPTAAEAPTNASLPKTTATGDTDFGTDAPVRTLAQTQNAAKASQPVETKLIRQPDGTYVTQDGTPIPGVEVNGVGSRGDDGAKTTNNPTVQNRLSELYGGVRGAIDSRDNVLDKFASYTYNLSWYLVDHETYNRLLFSDVKYLNNYYLLVQSGGAPIQTTSQNYVPVTSTGRSPFFPLDYYLDNFEFDQRVSGTPGTRGAAKLTALSFTVTEPNGITLQRNLLNAVNDLYWSKNLVKKGTTVNFNEAHYVMVIRFYGYDAQGNLVLPIDNRQGLTDRQAAIEKFLPFNLTGIDFKVSNKLVEYTIKGKAIDQLTAFSTDRASIPQNFQFQGQTVRDMLVGATQVRTEWTTPAAGGKPGENVMSRTSATRDYTPASTGKPGESLQSQASAGQPPSNAAGAYTPTTTFQTTGLCAALNLFFQQEANLRGQGSLSDIYEIQFLDNIIADAKMRPTGTYTDKALVGVTGTNEIDPKRQNLNKETRIRSTTAGQQIVQFIDEVVRSSSYISDQANAEFVVDPATNIGEWKPRPASKAPFAWFDISCEARVIGYDEQLRCNIYRMIYRVAVYQTTLSSEYFNSGAFRGVHKTYNYWFTGQNTQVTQFEQSFNSLWTQTFSSSKTLAENFKNSVNSRVIWKKRFQPASNQTREGAEGDVYEAAANAADILYTADLAKITLQIIGDPAWIPTPRNVQPGEFVSSPWNPDDSINYVAGSPYFEINWNRPVDYNLDTGLMDPGKNNYFADRENNRAGLAQESVVYKATAIKSMFSRGKFTQELKGVWLMDGKDQTSTAVPATQDGSYDRAEATRLKNRTKIQNAGVQVLTDFQNQYRSSPTVQQGNEITSNTPEPPRPASPPPGGIAGINPPSKLPAGGFGSGGNNPSLAQNTAADIAVTSALPQDIAKDA